MFKFWKKKEKKEDETVKTIKHIYTVQIRNKHASKLNPQRIWFEFDEKRDIEEVFEDFMNWYEYKLNKPAYRWVGKDFISVFHRDNISSIDIYYTTK